jgi:hypothetical protein
MPFPDAPSGTVAVWYGDGPAFFRKSFGKAPEPAAVSPPDSEPPGTLLVALLGRLPVSLSEMAREFPARPPAQGEGLGEVALGHTTPDGPIFPARMEVGGHHVLALGNDLPMPEEAQRNAVSDSNWGDDFKASLEAHQAHVLLASMDGGDGPVVRLNALYALTAGIHPLNVADEYRRRPVGRVAPADRHHRRLSGAELSAQLYTS